MAGGNLETKLKDYFCSEENAKMDKKVLQELCKLLRQFYKPTARTYSSDNKTIKYLPTTHRFTQCTDKKIYERNEIKERD